MKRTKLKDRILPDYTRGEEIFNMVTHIVGGGFGVIALVSCVLVAAFHKNVWGIVSGSIYGVSLIVLYTMSSIYHGLPIKVGKNIGKKVMQVMDHCMIYLLIAGTYTPIVLGPLRVLSPGWGWSVFGVVWACAILGAVFTAIDLKKYSVFSMICYIGMGWCIVIAAKVTIDALTLPGFLWLLAGGIAYTVGAVLYGVGRKVKYMHSIFHIFVVIASVLQYVAIILYAM
ncbi:MAG: hemolysin III family protein [Clostridiales bacterium]|nr:hemolysin III family protein [Clostridiales bacterium]